MIDWFDDILNYLGASMRWGTGNVFEIVLGTKNLTFVEVLNGPENKSEMEGGIGHRNANRFIGMLIIAAIVLSVLSGLGLI